MVAIGLAFAGLAALIHVYIFYLESLAWTAPATRRTFGTTREQAEQTRELAFNQGFYNLFLALIALAGVAFWGAGQAEIGAALLLAGTGSMLAAALLLFVTSPDKRRAAITQGFLPLLAVAAAIAALVLG